MSKKLKVGFVLDDGLDSADGVQQYILTLGRWLISRGHEVHYLVGHTKRNDIKNIHSLSKNLSVRANKNRMNTPLPANSSRIKKLLEEEKFDILHVQLPYSPFLAAKVINNAPKTAAIIGTFHILPHTKKDELATSALGRVLKKSNLRFDEVVSVSEPAAKFAEKTFKLKSKVVPNTVETSRFKTGKKLKKYDDGSTNIVYLGRLVKRKGCGYLIDALSNLYREKSLDNVRVLIISKGPLEKKLKDKVKKYGMENIVEFVGFIDEADKPDYLASADIAVYPSTGGESFGIVLVEAMAAGAGTVIAGDNPGYASVMSPIAGQLVNPSDTNEFAGILYKYLKNKNLRDETRQKQIELSEKFDVKTVGNDIEKIYYKHIK